ncbi:hypothetical protein AAFA46_02420 [Oscillospiraceae bacterium WX1]
MTSENLWDLFAETGDVSYYLLYAAANRDRAPAMESDMTDRPAAS